MTVKHADGQRTGCPGCDDKEDLPLYIVQWLRTRNGGELWRSFADMKVEDFEILLDELGLILHHGGHPPNRKPLK